MDKKQRELANNLLQTASDRLKKASGDISAFNLLSALQLEHLETQTHSKIIFYLLNDDRGQNVPNSFLSIFLRVLNIPQKYIDETWRINREQAVGSGRVDFVMESESYYIMIEMKIEAGDGDRQLMRYEKSARKKGKEYLIYYLTLDGHRPEDQSARGISAAKLRCISFREEIISWLQKCMECVDKCGYKYSFLKQYLGAVRHITAANDEAITVKDLLNNSDMLKAAKLVVNSFDEKCKDIRAQFFEKLNVLIGQNAKLETTLYDRGIDVYLQKFAYRKHTYVVILSIECFDDPCLVACIGFAEVTNNEIISLGADEAKKTFPQIYDKWSAKFVSLKDLPRIRRWKSSRYFVLEDSRGAQLNFSDKTAQIELIDEMDQQCEYICDNIVNRIIKPLLGG